VSAHARGRCLSHAFKRVLPSWWQAKLLAALKPEALDALKRGSGGGLEDVTEEEDWDRHLKMTEELGMPLVVDFGGKFCKPCKAIKPFVVDLSNEFTLCKFLYVDVDELSEVALDRYGVVALPTFKVFKWGKECATLTGVDGDELKQKLRDLCTKHSPLLDADGKPTTTLNPASETTKDK
jgi:thiol-disulfide isomerase/thioredoxin